MYVDLETMKETLGMQAESYADDDLQSAIASAEEVVEDYCGRAFVVVDDDTDEETRTYAPRRSRSIWIDDATEVSQVEHDVYDSGTFTAYAAGDFELWPLNPVAGYPYTEVRLRPHLSSYSSVAFCPGETRVRVTGKFGWPAIPDRVKLAASMLTSRFLKRSREAPFGIAGIGADGIVVAIRRTDPDVAMLLNPISKTTRLS